MQLMMKRILRFLASKLFIAGILILIQLGFLLYLILMLSEYFMPIYFLLVAFSLFVSIYIMDKNENPSYKLVWVVLIMAMPIFGGLI